jgi:transposase-like protein
MRNPRKIARLFEYYDSEPNCYCLLRQMRWGERGPYCPKCRWPKLWIYPKPSGRQYYICQKCRYHFNDLTGTNLNGLRIPMPQYFRSYFLNVLYRDMPTALLAVLCDVDFKTARRFRDLQKNPNR